MDNPNYTIEHRKGQHLTNEERGIIQAHLRDRWSTYRIAKDLRRPYNTIKNEIERGTIALYNGSIKRYNAEAGAAAYREHRKNCINPTNGWGQQPLSAMLKRISLARNTGL